MKLIFPSPSSPSSFPFPSVAGWANGSLTETWRRHLLPQRGTVQEYRPVQSEEILWRADQRVVGWTRKLRHWRLCFHWKGLIFLKPLFSCCNFSPLSPSLLPLFLPLSLSFLLSPSLFQVRGDGGSIIRKDLNLEVVLKAKFRSCTNNYIRAKFKSCTKG